MKRVILQLPLDSTFEFHKEFDSNHSLVAVISDDLPDEYEAGDGNTIRVNLVELLKRKQGKKGRKK